MKILSPKEIYKTLSKRVIGQEDAKKTLSNLLYMHAAKAYQLVDQPSKVKPLRLNGLVTGPTGTGKTFMIELICEQLDLPFISIDATDLGLGGSWHGEGIKDKLQLYYAAHRKHKNVARGVIFIDEVDKLVGKEHEHFASVQHALLRAVDGDVVTFTEKSSPVYNYTLDTSDLLFIFGGAFVASRETSRPKSIGFSASAESLSDERLSSPLTHDELIKAGMSKELLGRIGVITYTNRLTDGELRKILMEGEHSIISRFDDLFSKSGAYVPLRSDAIDEIIKKVQRSSSNVRALQTEVYSHFSDQIFDLELSITTQEEIDEYNSEKMSVASFREAVAAYEDLDYTFSSSDEDDKK